MITIQSILKEINNHRTTLILANLVAIIATLVSLPIPMLIPLLIDEIILGNGGEVTHFIDQYITVSSPAYYILIVLIATMLFKVISMLFNLVHIRLYTRISKQVIYTVRKRLLNHLQKVSMSEYDMLGSGSVAAKLVTDIETLDKYVASTVGEIIVETLTLIGVAVVILWLNWQLALVILLLNPISIYFFLHVFRKVSKIKKQENKAIENFQNDLTESLELYNQIRVQNREGFFLRRIDTQAKDIRDKGYQFGLKSEMSLEIARMMIMYSHDIFRATGIFMVLLGSLTIGKMLAIFTYSWILMRPVDKIMNYAHFYFNAKTSIKRLNEILGLHAEPY